MTTQDPDIDEWVSTFTAELDRADDLDAAVHVIVGAGSMCWETLEHAGTFDTDRAHAVAVALIRWVELHYQHRAAPPGIARYAGVQIQP